MDDCHSQNGGLRDNFTAQPDDGGIFKSLYIRS